VGILWTSASAFVVAVLKPKARKMREKISREALTRIEEQRRKTNAKINKPVAGVAKHLNLRPSSSLK
jgi:hypothetical protein